MSNVICILLAILAYITAMGSVIYAMMYSSYGRDKDFVKSLISLGICMISIYVTVFVA